MKRKINVKSHKRRTRKGFVPVRQHTKKITKVGRFKVKYVPGRILKDYVGMNYYAGKQIGFKPLPKENELLVNKTLKDRDKRTTINHELIEAELMKKGSNYWSAHKKALAQEKDFKNFGSDWTDEDFDWAIRNIDNPAVDKSDKDKAFAILQSDDMYKDFLVEAFPQKFRYGSRDIRPKGVEPVRRDYKEFWPKRELVEVEGFVPNKTAEETIRDQKRELQSELLAESKVSKYIDFHTRMTPSGDRIIVKGYRRAKPNLSSDWSYDDYKDALKTIDRVTTPERKRRALKIIKEFDEDMQQQTKERYDY